MIPFRELVRKRSLWAVAACAVAVLALVLGRGRAVPVKVQRIEPGELRVVVNATTTSTVRSENEVILSAQRTGKVVQLPVEEGDRVRQGALIAQLDLTEESVQSEGLLGQARATYEEAEKNLKRMQDLFDKGMVSQQDLDAVRRAHDVARSQYRAATEDRKVREGYTVVRAPFSGVIAKKYTEVGELLLPGKQIVTMVDPDRIYVLSTIDEVDVGRLRHGQPVAITVDAFPGERFMGTVKRVSPIVSGGKLETRTADVWIHFDAAQPRIKPGMSTDVEILIATLKDVLSVPSQAVIERDGAKQVYVLEGGDARPGGTARARLRRVETGETNWSYTQVVNGLASGDAVVTTPEAEGLGDGARVMVEQ